MIEEVYRDGFNLLCGRQIGHGMTRKVFTCSIDPERYVVKVESDEIRTHFQNMQEWFVWNRVVGTEFEKCFAPVHEISPDGRCLVMHRTTPLLYLPTHVPVFFTDLKPSNFGMYKGKVVCHDYGSNLLMEVGMTKRLKRTEWRKD